MLNVGILGAGRIAENMAYTLTEMEKTGQGARLYAVGSRSGEKAGLFAEKWGADKAYGSYEELAQDAEVDLVYVATPHSHHYEHARLCLLSGRNVLVEKAFTINEKQARELVELAREKNLLLAEALWTRYLPMRNKLDEIIAAGAIGEAQSLTANLGYEIMTKSERCYKPELAGGALLDLGVYVVNFALMTFGGDIKEITSEATLYHTGVDAVNRIKFTYKDGKTAELVSTMLENTDQKGIIKGTEGWIEFDHINCCQWIKVHKNDGTVTHYDPPPQITGFEYQVRACAEAIAAGECECRAMPHSEILRVMGIMDGLRREWGVIYPGENWGVEQKSLAERIHGLFQECFPKYLTPPERLAERLNLDECQCLFTADDAGAVVVGGGAVKLLMVTPEKQRQGIGTRLLKEAEMLLGGGKITLGQGADGYCFQGVPVTESTAWVVEFFEKNGYAFDHESVDMTMRLSDFDYENCKYKAPEGIAFRFVDKAGEWEKLMSAVAEVAEDWPQYFDREESEVIVAVDGEEILGFALVDYDDLPYSEREGDRTGGTGCVGVRPKARKRGIGLAMVAYGMNELKRGGSDVSYIGCAVLESWYAKLGHETFIRFKMGGGLTNN